MKEESLSSSCASRSYGVVEYQRRDEACKNDNDLHCRNNLFLASKRHYTTGKVVLFCCISLREIPRCSMECIAGNSVIVHLKNPLYTIKTRTEAANGFLENEEMLSRRFGCVQPICELIPLRELLILWFYATI